MNTCRWLGVVQKCLVETIVFMSKNEINILETIVTRHQGKHVRKVAHRRTLPSIMIPGVIFQGRMSYFGVESEIKKTRQP